MPGIINLSKFKFSFTFIGLGATGSHCLRSFVQEISLSKAMYDYILLVDGDTVEEKNIKRQLFVQEDLQKHKVDVLQEVYSNFYDVRIAAYSEYVKDLQQVHELVVRDETSLPVIVASLDNSGTRQLLDQYFKSELCPNLLYIDVGVHEISKNHEGVFDVKTGNNGQIIVGLKLRNKVILPPLSFYDPAMLEDMSSPIPGCGVVVESVPQRLMTNKFSAQLVSNILATLVHEQVVLVKKVSFDSRYQLSRPDYVSEQQQQEFEIE